MKNISILLGILFVFANSFMLGMEKPEFDWNSTYAPLKQKAQFRTKQKRIEGLNGLLNGFSESNAEQTMRTIIQNKKALSEVSRDTLQWFADVHVPTILSVTKRAASRGDIQLMQNAAILVKIFHPYIGHKSRIGHIQSLMQFCNDYKLGQDVLVQLISLREGLGEQVSLKDKMRRQVSASHFILKLLENSKRDSLPDNIRQELESIAERLHGAKSLPKQTSKQSPRKVKKAMNRILTPTSDIVNAQAAHDTEVESATTHEAQADQPIILQQKQPKRLGLPADWQFSREESSTQEEDVPDALKVLVPEDFDFQDLETAWALAQEEQKPLEGIFSTQEEQSNETTSRVQSLIDDFEAIAFSPYPYKRG